MKEKLLVLVKRFSNWQKFHDGIFVDYPLVGYTKHYIFCQYAKRPNLSQSSWGVLHWYGLMN